MFDVTALGEILIDFTSAGESNQDNTFFERNPGGAPANLLACIAKLGGKTAFIGKVGNDIFGQYLYSVLRDLTIEARGLRFTDEAKTTLAFVALNEQGERSFSFYRNPGADTTLKSREVDLELIKESKVFHFGSLSMTDEPSRGATLKAVRFARKNGCLVSYDPNLRLPLWKSEAHALKGIKTGLKYAHILKVSEDELQFISDEKDMVQGAAKLYEAYKIPLILVTLGAKGCYYRFGELTGYRNAFTNHSTIDTTGAGDAFLGGFLFSLLQHNITRLEQLDQTLLEETITFANAVASLCVTGRGAIPAMPDLKSVQSLLDQGIE